MPRSTKTMLVAALATSLSAGVMTGCASYREAEPAPRVRADPAAQRLVRIDRSIAGPRNSSSKYRIVRQRTKASRTEQTAVRIAPQPAATSVPSPAPDIKVVPPAVKAAPIQRAAPSPAAREPAAPSAQPAPPAPAPIDPLPTQPLPPPPRPDPVPAPPNRVNLTPSQQSGGGIAGWQPGARREGAKPLEEPRKDITGAEQAARGSIAMTALGSARVEEARRLLARGKVTEARVLLEAATVATPASALLELARTYDPYYLGMLATIDDGSEPQRAAALYQEAILHGSEAAGTDLDRLRAGHASVR